MSPAPWVVVGAGFGGLAAAVRLRAMGHRVVVVEATDQPGGRGAVFRQDGFTFDAGPTVITAPYLLDELFSLVGRDARDYYDLVPVDPFYRVLFPDGSSFDYVGDEERILAQIAEMSPGDVDGYRKLAADAQAIFDVGYTKLVDRSFDRLSDMLRVVPEMIRLESWRSVYGMVGRHIADERLRQVFTFQPLLVGGNPYDTSSIYLLIHWLERKWGVWFPRGGTGSVVRALVELLRELDVEVRLDSPVEHIDVENGRAVGVRLAGGERIACAGVVSNGDPSHTYGKLVDAADRPSHSDRAIARKNPSMSLYVAYFGAKRRYDVAHHTIVLGPRYKGLLDDIFDKKKLADDFSLYLHAPTVTDSSLAPAGHEAFYVLSPVPNQRSGIDWEKEGDAYGQRILDSLDRRGILPGIGAELVSWKTVDPRYFEGRLRSVDGAAFGIAPTLTQSAYFRYHNKSEDIEGLYFVGASTHPGAGVPGVLNSAKVLERVVPRPEVAVPVPAPTARRVAS